MRDDISPFEAVLDRDANALPRQFVDQYFVRPSDVDHAVLVGSMSRIWHRPRWIWPMLRVLAVFDIIFPEQGINVPAEMTIQGLRDSSGRPAQAWRRSFALLSPRRFDAIMSFDRDMDRVVEWLKPWNLIEVIWDVAFDPPRTIRITAARMRLGRGSRRVTLPTWMVPRVSAIETAVGDHEITISLVVSHPLLGDFFGYDGRFNVRRESTASSRG